jgi:hypothetical protein
VGKRWSFIVEVIFVLSCLCNATVALVEAAQSLDGFLVSFLWGKSYALQILPYPAFIKWPSPDCNLPPGVDQPTEPSTAMPVPDLSLCSGAPFNGSGGLIITLGYVLATIIFLPFGTGHLKEAMSLQVLVFIFFIFLLWQFYGEFFKTGFSVHVPLIGDYIWDVPGVILYNYGKQPCLMKRS